MKKVIVILLVIIVALVAFINHKSQVNYWGAVENTPQAQSIKDETSNQYSDWKSTTWNGVSFQYPSNWKIESKSMESTGKLMEDRIFIQGPSGENQAIIVIKNPAPESFKNFMTLRTVKSVTFAIPAMLSEESQKIFLQVVASAK